MNRTTLALTVLLVAALLAAGFLLLRNLGIYQGASRAKSVPRSDQEIAYIHAATSGTSWERFVAAIHHLAKTRTDLQLEIHPKSNPTPEQTTAVPEIGVRVRGAEHWLWIRWYKLTADTGHKEWVQALLKRDPPPLAIVGGSSTDRAYDLAKELRAAQADCRAPPLLLITNATADTVRGGTDTPDLMDIYPERSFRFCFTNSQMAKAVADFVWRRPHLRPTGSEPTPYAVEWLDDPYSTDLSYQFQREFEALQIRPDFQGPRMRPVEVRPVVHSIGGYYHPNPHEARVVEALIEQLRSLKEERSLLVLPAVDRPARRFIRALAAAAPAEARGLVVITGDSISFNTIYRDRATAWNIQELPAPLVFFCHENPIDPSALPADRRLTVLPRAALDPDAPLPWPLPESLPLDFSASQATDDLLLNVALLQRLLEGSYSAEGQLVAGSDELAGALRASSLGGSGVPFFQTNGNRQEGSGEYIVCLRPHQHEGQILPVATIEVWAWRANGGPAGTSRSWDYRGALLVGYGGKS